MRDKLSAVAVAVSLAMMALPLAAQQSGQITVTGDGVVQSKPDMAQIDLGVSTQAGSAAEALRANSSAMAAVLARLQAAGLDPADMQTSQLSLQPEWNYGDGAQPSQVLGYSASNMLTVTLRDLARLGAVLDAVVSDGANSLNGVTFAVTDPKPLQEEARALAVQDARAKADAMSRAAGVNLGRILSITEVGGFETAAPMAGAMASKDAAIATGEVGTAAQVTMVFEIAP